MEQCLRNVLIRKEYLPPRRAPQADDPLAAGTAAVRQGAWTADQLLRWYCTVVYARTGSYEATARQLQLDRRTVKAKLDTDLLTRLTQNREAPHS